MIIAGLAATAPVRPSIVGFRVSCCTLRMCIYMYISLAVHAIILGISTYFNTVIVKAMLLCVICAFKRPVSVSAASDRFCSSYTSYCHDDCYDSNFIVSMRFRTHAI